MKQRFPIYLLVAVGLVALAGGISGCSPEPSSQSVAPEQQIKARAEARWDALARGDFAAAYAFETPAFRAITSLEAFRSKYGHQVRWYGAQVREVKRKDKVAEVLLWVEYEVPMPNGESHKNRRGAKETWILKDGNWWFLRE